MCQSILSGIRIPVKLRLNMHKLLSGDMKKRREMEGSASGPGIGQRFEIVTKQISLASFQKR